MAGHREIPDAEVASDARSSTVESTHATDVQECCRRGGRSPMRSTALLPPDIGKAPMLLAFRNVTFTHAESSDPLFQDLHASLAPGWTGVIGANGSGKTTLLRLALGELRPDTGRVEHPGRGVCCPQRTDLPPGGMQAFLQGEDSRTRRWLARLGIDPDWGNRWDTLSHGERKRIQLAMALSNEPHVLGVDEPTNHLDREARAQVVSALAAFRGIGLLVSHDRELLDALCDQCLFLEPPRAVLRPGNYSQGAREREREETALRRERERADLQVERLAAELHERRVHNDRGERSRSKRGLARGDSDGRARANGAKVMDGSSGQRLRQMEGRLRQAVALAKGKSVARRFRTGVVLEGERSPRARLACLPECRLPLGPKASLLVPSLVIGATDRIGIVGPNGAGKSTLVRRIVAGLDPGRTAYVPQEIDAAASRRILAELLALPPDVLGPSMSVVRRLGSDPARLLQSRDPSPGEVRKLLIAKHIGSRPSVLVLDEPTNHMDLASIECLEEALAAFDAALVLVSHDDRFLSRLATRIWAIHLEEAGRWALRETADRISA